jgi:hypothetical protein
MSYALSSPRLRRSIQRFGLHRRLKELNDLSKARVTQGNHVFGGWVGELTVDQDYLEIRGNGATQYVRVEGAQIKRASFNGMNGLWAIRMKDGTKYRIQSSGLLLSADRSAAGKQANKDIGALVDRHR